MGGDAGSGSETPAPAVALLARTSSVPLVPRKQRPRQAVPRAATAPEAMAEVSAQVKVPQVASRGKSSRAVRVAAAQV